MYRLRAYLFIITGALFLLLSCPVFHSCKRHNIYHSEQMIKNQVWNRFDKKVFEIPVNQAGDVYDFTLTMGNTDQFPYDEMQVYAILTTPSGEERMREASIKVKGSSMTGEPTGGTWLSKTSLWKAVKIEKKGKCILTIENLVPKYDTPGIDRIGIEVTRSE